jgi:hypothetical protein
MSEAAAIKRHYIKPAIILIETDYEKQKIGSRFEVYTTIWVDRHLPYYEVVIPEDVSWRFNTAKYCKESNWTPGQDIETRRLKYMPTGRIVYDNSLPHKDAIVWEYIWEGLRPEKDLV